MRMPSRCEFPKISEDWEKTKCENDGASFILLVEVYVLDCEDFWCLLQILIDDAHPLGRDFHHELYCLDDSQIYRKMYSE